MFAMRGFDICNGDCNEILTARVIYPRPDSLRDNIMIYIYNVRYGYRPIPSEIDTAELELLREALVQMGNDVHLLDKWYRKDSNKVIIKLLYLYYRVKCCKSQHYNRHIWTLRQTAAPVGGCGSFIQR